MRKITLSRNLKNLALIVMANKVLEQAFAIIKSGKPLRRKL
ncbi:hypothetical protein [uncultured Dokdonia sp.]|nr:hypothetical protein [uncultured Dokdonia sp.]